MSRKPTYQELANATLAKTQLGAVTQPYVPYNDNALAVKELRAMTDRLAATERASQSTQAQVFATAAETGLPPQTVQAAVDHAALAISLQQTFQPMFEQAQTAQNRASEKQAEKLL